jgi:hypothetical protein
MRVNIIGKAVGWKDAMNLRTEKWGVNDLFLRPAAKLTRVFDMHEAATLRDQAEQAGLPYVCFDNYPLDAIVKKFGSDYFTSSIDYMIALALYEGAKDIHIWGVDMAIPNEYDHQKPGCEYWIGYARGKGAKVAVHGKYTRLLRTKTGKRYGVR